MSAIADRKRVPPSSVFASGFARALIRFASRLANPLLARLAATRWLPMLGVLIHKGRQTGHIYRTPVGVGRIGAAVFLPLTFGSESHWFRNVDAVGAATLRWRGGSWRLTLPEVVDAGVARGAFIAPLWFLLRLLRIDRYLKLTVEGAPSADAPSGSDRL